MHDLENEFTDVLPGLSVPAGVADFVFARIGWISEGEIGDFDVEAPPPWNLNDLCTLSFFVMNRETTAVRLMVSHLFQPPSFLLTSSTLVTQNNNFLKKTPFRRRRKQRSVSSPLKNIARRPQVMGAYLNNCVFGCSQMNATGLGVDNDVIVFRCARSLRPGGQPCQPHQVERFFLTLIDPRF